MACTVVIVQHAEKESTPGDPELTPLGRRQAEQVAAHVSGMGRAAGLFSSPLRRAVETAEPIAQAIGLRVVKDDRVRERMNWEGGPTQSLESFLEDWKRTTRERDFRPTTGDSSNDTALRFRSFLEDLDSQGLVIVVSHGGVTCDLLRDLIGDDQLRARNPELIESGVPSAALTTLTRDKHGWEVIDIASTDHLPGI
jgi:broad specificity phosphatase PhoE